MRAVFVVAMLSCASAASAADKLPLKRGIFVDTSVKCSERSNATVVSFWGDALNTARTVGKIRKVARSGKTYTVHLEMEHMDGEKERAVWRLVILNPKTFTITNDGGSWSNRWCSPTM